MRKVIKWTKIEEVEHSKTEVFCDLCGKQAPRITSWAEGIYEVNNVEIKTTIHHREGSSYPEGGSGTEVNIDLCPDCVKNKLIPWLESQGADIREKEWEW